MARKLYERADDNQVPRSAAMTIARVVQRALHFKCESWIESLATLPISANAAQLVPRLDDTVVGTLRS